MTDATIPMRYLKNLSSHAMSEGVAPWEFKPTSPIPDEVRKDKKLRDGWISNPATDHYVYSGNQGVNPNMRICSEKPDGSGNPVYSTYLLIFDFDREYTIEQALAEVKKLQFVPQFIERTLSGNIRLIYVLPFPIVWPRPSFYKHFFSKFDERCFQISTALMGFDRGAMLAAERLYTNSCEWVEVPGATPIPEDVVTGWMVKASADFDFEKEGLVIPLDVIFEEAKKRFPGFTWPGDFTLGSQGPSFWVSGSTSPKSAQVRETGMQCYAAHATKAFYTWAEIFGADFVRTYEAQALGRAVQGIYFDCKHYYRQITTGEWKGFEKGDIVNHLIAQRGVSQKIAKGANCSMLQQAINYIHNNHAIDGAAPVWAQPQGVINMNGDKVLNIAESVVLRPASIMNSKNTSEKQQAVWGATGQFPWLSNFLDTLFTSKEQLEAFKAWLSHYYRWAFEMKPRNGQNVFLVGGVGVGKTFLIRCVVGGLIGGYAEAKEYLMGQDLFGSELFSKGLWTIDDGSIATDPLQHRVFSEMIKRVAANQTFRYHAKFRIPTMVEWLGRVMISLNADEDSIRLIPDLDISILDKICIFRCIDSRQPGFFPEPEKLQAILGRELPWLARYLLEYQIPEDRKGDVRYGIKPYHEESVVQKAQQSSDSAAFTEILQDWRDWYFEKEIKAEYWEGTSYQLHRELTGQSTAEAMRSFTVAAVGRHLSALKNKGAPYIQIPEEKQGKVRVWRIHREDKPFTK